MEENNKTAAQNPQSQNTPAAGGENKNRRRRGHRGGKKHQEKKQRAAAAAAAATTENGAKPENGVKPENAAPKSEKNTQAVQKNNQQGNKKNDNRNHHNHRNNHQKDNRKPLDRIPQKDDIYGDPKEEKELAEWRAKIVLNNQAPAKAAAPEEPMPQLSDEELFASPTPTSASSANEGEEKVEVIGIRFRSAGKVYYFDPRGQKLKKGEFAIVETARGPEFGEVNLENTMVNVSETVTPLRPLIRVATPADIEHNEENREKEKNALVVCQQKIEAHKLDMKLIDVQYAFDNSKLLFYFSSEGRVDFRELVKDLASVFRTRIELRQIGIRDEAKMLGGIGSCGRMLCCTTFLPDFAQVSIKMAKEQGLSLNSAKISGMCGRLMCCLHFEAETYTEEIKRTPAVDSQVKTEDGIGTVISTNPLAGTIRVILKDSPDTPPKQYHRSEVTPLGKAPKNSENKEDLAE
jgi:cell fate regulator YaaT (PSP1 superfamily)